MADLELTLRDLARTGASATAIAGLVLLVLALSAELLRRRDAKSTLLRVADRFVPTPVQRVAAGILALLATATSVAMPSIASADTSLRGWLESPSVPTTVVTPATSSPSVQPYVKPSEPASNRPAGRPGSVRTLPDLQKPSAADPTAPAAQIPTTVATPKAPQSPAPAPVVHRRSAPGPQVASSGAGRRPSSVAPAPSSPPTPASAVPAADVSPLPANSSTQYVVVAGDCLWNIAARLIGPSASNAAIDRGWRAIYAANRIAIGDDPGLIHPGLVLTIPAFDPAP